MKPVCEYGCGEVGRYQFKNGKWCCSDYPTKCPAVKRKNSEGNKKVWANTESVFNSEEYKEKQSQTSTGRIPWNKNKTKENDIRVLKQAISLKKTWFNEDSYLNSEEHRDKLKITQNKPQVKFKKIITSRFTIKQIQENHPFFAKIEEMRYKPGRENEKIIQVHCKNHNCENSKEKDGWFMPTYNQLYERIRQIESENGNGGSYFYCCDECKDICPTYGKSANELIKEDQIAAGIIEDPWNTSAEEALWRKYIFKLDDGLCVWCGAPATCVHHIFPRKTHPNLAVDKDNGLSCCEECHYKYGHRDRWCTTGYLANLVCERIVRIDKKAKK